MVPGEAESLNTLFQELQDWEAQLKPFEKEIHKLLDEADDEIGGPEL